VVDGFAGDDERRKSLGKAAWRPHHEAMERLRSILVLLTGLGLGCSNGGSTSGGHDAAHGENDAAIHDGRGHDATTHVADASHGDAGRITDALADAFAGRSGDLGANSPVIDHSGPGGGYVTPVQQGAVGTTWQPGGCTGTVPIATGITGAEWGGDAYGAIDRSPHAVHTSWSTDTSSSLAAIWETDQGTTATVVAYGDSPTKLDHFAQGVTFINPPQPLDILAYPLRAHEVHVCGLLPSHTYYFAVGGDGWFGNVYSAKTAPAVGATTSFRFVVAGDSNNIAYPFWAQLVAKLPSYSPDWMLFTGDLVHVGTSQEEWEQWFAASGPFIATVPTMTVHGNHEDMATAYFALFAMPGQEDVYSFDYGNVHFVVLNDSPPSDDELTGFEATFLDQDLTAAEARPVPPTWIVTSHHRPMFDSDPDEGSNLTVRAAWHAIMQNHHVDVDFNGHAHHYESTTPIGADGGVVDAGGTRFVTSGGAGAIYDSPDATPNPWTIVYYAGLSFGIVDVDGSTLTLQGYRVDGTKLESAPIVLTK
jgi:hypothetical protein